MTVLALPRPLIAIGDTVRIIDGISRGKVGTVSAAWPTPFPVGKREVPRWVVELGGVLAGRVVRADFLQVINDSEAA